MVLWWWVFVAFIVGGILGMILAAAMSAAGNAEYEMLYLNERDKNHAEPQPVDAEITPPPVGADPPPGRVPEPRADR